MENKYLVEFTKIVGDLQGWVLALIVVAVGFVTAIHGLRYMQGGAHERSQAISDMKSTAYMGLGIFFIIWLLTSLVARFKGL